MSRSLTRPSAVPVELSAKQRAALRRLEDVLATARTWAVEEAKALLEIQENGLWQGKYESFADYGERRWGYEHSQLYRLVAWAEVIRAVSPLGDRIPLRETHARPLYGLRSEEQREVWQKVCRRFGSERTARDIVTVVREHIRSQSPQPSMKSGRANEGTIICADCLDGIRTLDDRSVDMFLFSPPYCEQRNDTYPGVPEDRYPAWMVEVMQAIRPKLVDRGNVLIVAREHLRDGQISDVWLKTRLAMREAGWRECETLIWHSPDKPPLGSNRRPRRVWEYVHWFALSPQPFVDLLACGHRMSDETETIRRPRGKRPEFFARLRGGGIARITDLLLAHVGEVPPHIPHPSMKPPRLAEQLVQTFSPAGGLVADCFAGSGTTLVAARDTGRRWWGCDIVEEYVSLSRMRLQS